MLEFNKEKHEYTFDGLKVPSVTTILKPLTDYSKVPGKVLEHARGRGNDIHKACELYIWGVLDYGSVAEEYRPYVDAFKQFLVDTKFEALHVEERVYHPRLKYAGTFDLGGILPAMGRFKKDRKVLIDIKNTYQFMKSVGPQTAAYKSAWDDAVDIADRFQARYSLRLLRTGKYELLPQRDTMDIAVFQSCLNIYNFTKESK